MKFAIDCGHTLSGYDTGAQGCGFREENKTREIGKLCVSKIESLGHSALIVSKDTCTSLMDSLQYRANTANNYGADVYVSIHLNAFTNPDANGVGTYVGTSASAASREYARKIQNELVKLNYYDRGVNVQSIYVLNNTKMPAVLVECGFITNSNDMSKFSADAFATAIVNGLCNSDLTVNPVDSVHSTPTYINTTNIYTKITQYITSIDKTVKELQTKLIACGYACGGYGADGSFGTATYNSLVSFQKDKGLVADGYPGPKTFAKLDAILSTRASVNNNVKKLQDAIISMGSPITSDGIAGPETLARCPLVKYGSNNAVVGVLQTILGIASDNIFGKNTENAVKSYQSSKGLTADGVVGPNTWKKILGL